MKYILIPILFITTTSILFSQNTVVIDGVCEEYDIIINDASQSHLGQCIYESPSIDPGTTYNLKVGNGAIPNLSGVNTADLIVIQRALLGIENFQSDLAAYNADFDQDGAVSTYDLVAMRSAILGITTPDPVYGVVLSNQEIPVIDPFDIQVDYSELSFSSEDLQDEQLKINVLRRGDIN